MVEDGFAFGASRLLRRVWQIYTAHVLLFVIYLASVHFFSNKFSAPDFIDRFNVGPLLASPVETITQGLLLRYKPLNLDVLPLYVVLMSAFPPVLWLMLRYRNWVMAGSILLYFATRQFSWNLPSFPSGVWYFNPFAWQLLFVLGAWLALGGANTVHFLVRSRAVLIFGLAYLFFATAMTMAGQIPELQKLFPRVLFEAFNPNDKTNLAPYRFLHLAVLIILGARFIPIDASGLQAALWKPVIKCGQQSLEVFAVGIYLSFLGYFVLQTTSSGVIAQLLVGAGGISIMTTVAYYRSWSKRVEKHPHGHSNLLASAKTSRSRRRSQSNQVKKWLSAPPELYGQYADPPGGPRQLISEIPAIWTRAGSFPRAWHWRARNYGRVAPVKDGGWFACHRISG